MTHRTRKPPNPRATPRRATPRSAFPCIALLALALALGCGKGESDDAPVDDMPPAVSESERERGMEACTAYVARVCSCAQEKPDDSDMKERCDLAPGKLSSLKMVLRVNRSPENADERVKTSATARRIIGSCITEQSKLDSLGCARVP